MDKKLIREAIIDSQIYGSLKGCQRELERQGIPSEMVEHICSHCWNCVSD